MEGWEGHRIMGTKLPQFVASRYHSSTWVVSFGSGVNAIFACSRCPFRLLSDTLRRLLSAAISGLRSLRSPAPSALRS